MEPFVIHRAETRGFADHGWLKARHTFSFANYFDPERIHFGALRVLNDDLIAGGYGFDMHPHDNMEIITIPLHGALEHRDNTGGHGIIRHGDVQVMSAGTGVFHSEFNASPVEEVNLLQIWVFPNLKGVKPRYAQTSFPKDERRNQFQLIVGPMGCNSLEIYQNAWFHLIDPDQGTIHQYLAKHPHSGLYLFVIEGEIEILGQQLGRRDAIGIHHMQDGKISFTAHKSSQLLLMELPLQW